MSVEGRVTRLFQHGTTIIMEELEGGGEKIWLSGLDCTSSHILCKLNLCCGFLSLPQDVSALPTNQLILHVLLACMCV